MPTDSLLFAVRLLAQLFDYTVMHKLLTSLTVTATLFVSGCSSLTGDAKTVSEQFGDVNTLIPRALEHTPLLYKPTIQQGNVIDQEQVDKLKPGMSKRQVRFLLGTAMIDDVFHDNRWDYTYTKGVGSTPSDIKHVTLIFDNDRLLRISGDYRPMPADQQKKVDKEIVVTVPDWVPEDPTLLDRALNTFGIEEDEDAIEGGSLWDSFSGSSDDSPAAETETEPVEVQPTSTNTEPVEVEAKAANPEQSDDGKSWWDSVKETVGIDGDDDEAAKENVKQ